MVIQTCYLKQSFSHIIHFVEIYDNKMLFIFCMMYKKFSIFSGHRVLVYGSEGGMEYFACAPPHFFLQPRSCQGGPGNIWLVHPWQQTLLCSVDLTRKSYKKIKSRKKNYFRDNTKYIWYIIWKFKNNVSLINAGAWKG